jgi:hypothetical protein
VCVEVNSRACSLVSKLVVSIAMAPTVCLSRYPSNLNLEI